MAGHHQLNFKVLRNTLFALLSLTILTVLVAKPVSGFDAGMFNFVIAMGIASLKAGLVLAYFMQLKDDNKLYLGLMISCVFFLLLFFGLSFIDIISRAPVDSTL